MIFNKDIFLLFCVSILILNCGVYSFKGSSIPKDAQSIYIFEIQNNSPLSSPELSSLITENLNNYILSETNLKLFASPWSAPAWMKTNNNLTGDRS